MEEYSSDDSVDCSGRVPAENFRGDKHLECISLDPSCNYIMYGTFLYCVSLITMKLSSGIESIEDDAFLVVLHWIHYKFQLQYNVLGLDYSKNVVL